MRNLVSPVNAAFPGAFAIAVLASPAASAQQSAAGFEFHGVAQAELLQAIKMPNVDALYGEFGLTVTGERPSDEANILFPMKWDLDMLGVNDTSFQLDGYGQWAPNFGQTKAASMDGDVFLSALDYRAESSGSSVLGFGDYTHIDWVRPAD